MMARLAALLQNRRHILGESGLCLGRQSQHSGCHTNRSEKANVPGRKSDSHSYVSSDSVIGPELISPDFTMAHVFHLQSPKPIKKWRDPSMSMKTVSRYIGIVAGLSIITCAAPLFAAKQCYAPDARAKER